MHNLLTHVNLFYQEPNNVDVSLLHKGSIQFMQKELNNFPRRHLCPYLKMIQLLKPRGFQEQT
ncbi:hypothetical protein Lalb_Chr06g0172151 [Lupinus albus]|uniref:Uncharacterized protein n=1 Tax=Lupinus albus TaxID=3870 RepID=A0A6A4QEJ6_LUPAL|nr:hypothetical protein Lalb_Chr06g0172151 [Lupinus albus]